MYLLPCLLGCLLLSSCAALVATDSAIQSHGGLTVQKEQGRGKGGTLLRVRGAGWLRGGDAAAIFQREAAAQARANGCAEYRIEGLQESQEDTVFGTRRVMEGTLVCLD